MADLVVKDDELNIKTEDPNNVDKPLDLQDTFDFENVDDKVQDNINDYIKRSNYIKKTIVPMLFASLTELLGSSNLFEPQSLNIYLDSNDNVIGEITVIVDYFLGSDVPKEAIAKDSNYILNKLLVVANPLNIKITKCMINCIEGLVTVHVKV